ncbi:MULTISPECIES: helix-turn-helix transcriptional regulator [unclassified Rhodococcus (in: high G+C Gram-positive bacteria)]|uniref:ArsR/SmtB family transcription factor n=1 Tax=unclassified Rhodococcus (in: high G+C Gram-positive bacteria) TaxID=192944 RepID=UPI003399E42F
MSKQLDAVELAAVFSALGNPARLAILRSLKDPGSFPPQSEPAEEVGVCLKHIQSRAGVSQSTASQYMAVLQRANLVVSTKIGPWIHYKRNADYLQRLTETIRIDL